MYYVVCKVTTYICTLYLSTFMKSLGHLLLFYLTVLLNKKTKLQPSAIPEHNLDGIPVENQMTFLMKIRNFCFSDSCCNQSYYREVPRWEIFMEQELRFGLGRHSCHHSFKILCPSYETIIYL